MTMRKSRGWKAILAMVAAGGAVAWHIMACVESPMSFAPNGDLAFTVMDPYEPEEIGLAGEAVYRMLILNRDRELREVEASHTHMLSAPGYSPDGTRIAYLRVPLLTKDEVARIRGFLSGHYEDYKQVRDAPPDEKWIAIAPEGSRPQAPADPMNDMTDLALPPNEAAGELLGLLELGGGYNPVELVVRDAATGTVLNNVAVDLPSAEINALHALNYLLSRPQFAADGKSVHFWSNYFSMAVDLETGGKSVLAPPNFGSLMAPGGGTIATLGPEGESFGLVRSDGSRATYVRLEREASVSGLAWAGPDRLLILGKGRQGDTAALGAYDSGGGLVSAADLPITGADSDNSGELAVSPDGRHVVVSFGDEVHWLTVEGDVLASWKAGESREMLVQPTFTPDSKQVAFKHMAKVETPGRRAWAGTDAIAFFTPEGRELFRVPVPRAEPAEQSQPSQQ